MRNPFNSKIMHYIVVMIDPTSVNDSFVSNISDFSLDERKVLIDYIRKYEIKEKLSRKDRQYIWFIRSDVNCYYKIIENRDTTIINKIQPREFTKDEISIIANQFSKSEKLDIIKSTTRKMKHDISNPLTSVSLDIEFLKGIFEELGKFEEKIDMMVKEAFINLKLATDGIFNKMRAIKEISSEIIIIKDKNLDGELIDLDYSLFYLIEAMEFKINKGTSILFQYPKKLKLNINQNSFIRLLFYLIENSLENIETQESSSITIYITEYTNDCKITVTDNGPKLPTSTSLQQLTRPYFTTKSDHLGLGLAIVQQMISHVEGKMLLTCSEQGNLITDIRIPKIL
jgi:signal transduction histidine kinase